MAMDRTNMVSLLDIGLLNGGSSSNIVEMGDGYTELTEDWGPDIETTQYINMKAKASTMKGYEFSMTPEREYLSDDMQKALDDIFKDLPTGTKCETFYYRFFKTDITSNEGECIKVPVIVTPSSVGGEGGSVLTSAIQINGNGDAVKGKITITAGASGVEYTWSAS